MANRNKITIIILAVIIILAGSFFLWYSLTVDSKNPLKIIMNDDIFSGDENISFEIKNNSLRPYCFSDNFSNYNLNIASQHYPHSEFTLENYNGIEWVSVKRPNDYTISNEFYDECGVQIDQTTGMRTQIFSAKISPLEEKNYLLNKTATFSQGNCSYTWKLPVGEYRLKIYYGQCQKVGLFGDEARTEYYNTLKAAYSSVFEIKE